MRLIKFLLSIFFYLLSRHEFGSVFELENERGEKWQTAEHVIQYYNK